MGYDVFQVGAVVDVRPYFSLWTVVVLVPYIYYYDVRENEEDRRQL